MPSELNPEAVTASALDCPGCGARSGTKPTRPSEPGHPSSTHRMSPGQTGTGPGAGSDCS